MTSSLGDLATPLRTLDPTDSDLSDLEPLRALIGAARVAAIGESAHCVHEFYELKHRVLRFLVSELGFTAFVMESGFAEGLVVNDWVLGGDGDIERIANVGITYGFGDCPEMRAQLQWMRDWNATHERKVRFYGMDLPGSAASPRAAVEACLSRLDRRPEDVELLALSNLGDRFGAPARHAAMTSDERERLSSGLAGLVERAREMGQEIAYRCARSAQRVDEYLTGLRLHGGAHPGTRGVREEHMAENIRWILDREERIIVGAHNVHVQKGSFLGAPMLGKLLATMLDEALVTIGTTYASGQIIQKRNQTSPPAEWIVSLDELQAPPPHSVDALMSAVGLPLHVVDLRRLPVERIGGATTMLVHHSLIPIVPKEAFDALIHVEHVTPAPGLFETLHADIARIRA